MTEFSSLNSCMWSDAVTEMTGLTRKDSRWRIEDNQFCIRNASPGMPVDYSGGDI